MLFIELSELKNKLAIVGKIDAVKSPKTGKLFASAVSSTKGQVNLKVEQSIDYSLPTKFMYESEALLEEGCIVNVTPSAPPLHAW